MRNWRRKKYPPKYNPKPQKVSPKPLFFPPNRQAGSWWFVRIYSHHAGFTVSRGPPMSLCPQPGSVSDRELSSVSGGGWTVGWWAVVEGEDGQVYQAEAQHFTLSLLGKLFTLWGLSLLACKQFNCSSQWKPFKNPSKQSHAGLQDFLLGAELAWKLLLLRTRSSEDN